MSHLGIPKWLSSPLFWVPTLISLYLITRFFNLLGLPVFADEAIYIRWAQLLRHDGAYTYFSLNDGKPPLFMWLIASVLDLPFNVLWVSRALSAVIGLIQVLVTDRIIRQLGGNKLARFAGAIAVITAPFWFFHHRMALMDGLLAVLLSTSIWGLFRLQERTSRSSSMPSKVSSVILAGVGWGLAWWTKTPALFLAPFFLLVAWWNPFWSTLQGKRPQLSAFIERTILFGAAGALGLSIFLLLRLQPTFGSLFSRSSDFTFTIQEVLSGNWQTSLDNIGRFIEWMGANLRPELISLSLFGVLISQKRKTHWLLWLGALAFAVPLIVMGKTLHPRYFLPVAVFITPSAALMFEEAFGLLPKPKKDNLPWGQLVFAFVTGFYLLGSLRFMLLALFTPDQTPFVLEDRSQYLTEWSSGHGIREVRDKLLERARQQQRTTVVTEGSFGTLPDGLLLEFDNQPEIAHLRIQGLEQYPVTYLPEWVFEEAKKNETWLVVNEHRMKVPLDQVELIARYPRPYGAPELQVYKVKPR